MLLRLRSRLAALLDSFSPSKTGKGHASMWKDCGSLNIIQVSSSSVHHCEHHPDDYHKGWDYHDWLPMMQVNDMFPQIRGYSVLDVGRHYYITSVSCVPNGKNLPPIDGFQRSSNASLPEFATWEDFQNKRKLFSNRSHPLAEGQVLKSTGMCVSL